MRHLKTLGPVPVLWDRWTLANPFAPRLTLRQLLAAAAPQTELMLDLKGGHPLLGPAVAAALPAGLRVTICSRSWRLLKSFARRNDVRVVHSVGSSRQLRALLRRFEGRVLDGISIHERLLDAETVAQLRRRADLLMSWPVNTVERARELVALGVDGLISDDLTRIAGEA